MRRECHHVLLWCVLGLCLGTLVHAQTTGTVRGAVKDASGAVVPHATVILVNRSTSAQRDTATDDQGAYAFTVLPVGQYDLEIIFPGFLPYRRAGLTIDVNSALQVDAILQIAGQMENVTVNAEAVHIETAQTALSSGFNATGPLCESDPIVDLSGIRTSGLILVDFPCPRHSRAIAGHTGLRCKSHETSESRNLYCVVKA
jgi:hypothetical protein